MSKITRTFIISENHIEEIEKLTETIDSENETLSVTLKSPIEQSADHSDYKLVKIAFYNSCVDTIIFNETDTVCLEELNKLDKALLLVKYASNIMSQVEARKIIGSIVADKWQISILDLEELKTKTDVDTIKAVEFAISQREKNIKSSHTTFYNSEFSDNYNDIYTEILNSSDKLIVLNGKMGSGKTEATRKVYNDARIADLFPIMLTGKRTIASNFFSSDHADHYKTNSKEESKGLIGVVNSIVMSKNDEARKACKVLIIDEIEDLITQMSSEVLGKSYSQRVLAFDIFADLLRSVDKVIVTDATIVDSTIEKLFQITKETARIINSGQANNNTLYLNKESELIAKMIEDAKAGKKVAAFNDYNTEDFSEIVETLKLATGKKVIGITSAYLAETRQGVDDLPEILEAADIALISPVIQAGASIIDGRFESVYIMSGFTIDPIALIQSMGRFRCAKSVYLSFKRGVPSPRLADPRSIIHGSLIRSSEFPYTEAQIIYDTESGKYLADRTVSKNKLFKNFRQTVIIAAQQVGFNIVREEADIQKINAGKEAKKIGRLSNREISETAVNNASDLRLACRTKDIDFGKKDAQTYSQQQAERAINALDLLDLKSISEESYIEIFDLNIDSVILSRKILSKKISRSSELSRMDIASDVATKFLTEAGIDFDNLKKSEITKEKAEVAFENLLSPVALESGNPSTGLSLISIVFPLANFRKVNKIQTVKDCLNALGLTTINISKSNRERVYSVGDITKKIRKNKETIEHNITEIANKYLSIVINQSEVEIIEADDILITDDEKHARLMIDSKKARKEQSEFSKVASEEKKIIDTLGDEFALILSEIA